MISLWSLIYHMRYDKHCQDVEDADMAEFPAAVREAVKEAKVNSLVIQGMVTFVNFIVIFVIISEAKEGKQPPHDHCLS